MGELQLHNEINYRQLLGDSRSGFVYFVVWQRDDYEDTMIRFARSDKHARRCTTFAASARRVPNESTANCSAEIFNYPSARRCAVLLTCFNCVPNFAR